MHATVHSAQSRLRFRSLLAMTACLLVAALVYAADRQKLNVIGVVRKLNPDTGTIDIYTENGTITVGVAKSVKNSKAIAVGRALQFAILRDGESAEIVSVSGAPTGKAKVLFSMIAREIAAAQNRAGEGPTGEIPGNGVAPAMSPEAPAGPDSPKDTVYVLPAAVLDGDGGLTVDSEIVEFFSNISASDLYEIRGDGPHTLVDANPENRLFGHSEPQVSVTVPVRFSLKQTAWTTLAKSYRELLARKARARLGPFTLHNIQLKESTISKDEAATFPFSISIEQQAELQRQLKSQGYDESRFDHDAEMVVTSFAADATGYITTVVAEVFLFVRDRRLLNEHLSPKPIGYKVECLDRNGAVLHEVIDVMQYCGKRATAEAGSPTSRGMVVLARQLERQDMLMEASVVPTWKTWSPSLSYFSDNDTRLLFVPNLLGAHSTSPATPPRTGRLPLRITLPKRHLEKLGACEFDLRELPPDVL